MYKKVLNIELDAIHGKYDKLQSGTEYINPEHHYTSDLNVFGCNSLFSIINRTCTVHGKQILANWLMEPLKDKIMIESMQQAIRELSNKKDFRESFRATGLLFQKKDASLKSLNRWIHKEKTEYNKWWIYLLIYGVVLTNITLLILSICTIFPPTCFVLSLTAFAILSSGIDWKIDKAHDQISRGVNTLNAYSELLRMIAETSFDSAILIELQSKIIVKQNNILSDLNKLMHIINMLDQRKNLLLHYLLEGFMLWQLIQLIRVENWKRKHKDQLYTWLDVLGELDALCSISTFAFNHPQYSYPVLSDVTGTCVGNDLGHPFIPQEKCVPNAINICKTSYFLIVTGANMAGKSTYLRSVGINYLLACIGAPVCASYFEIYPAPLIASLHTSDSLLKNESYFFAELRKIKTIIDRLNSGETLFILLDEILKGTNSLDKEKGSMAFIEQLIFLRSNGIIATHDIQLGSLENKYPQSVENYHFEAEIINDKLFFDYKLKHGIVKDLNACFLMQKMGIILSL